jgi:hypothetical protein
MNNQNARNEDESRLKHTTTGTDKQNARAALFSRSTQSWNLQQFSRDLVLHQSSPFQSQKAKL